MYLNSVSSMFLKLNISLFLVAAPSEVSDGKAFLKNPSTFPTIISRPSSFC